MVVKPQGMMTTAARAERAISCHQEPLSRPPEGSIPYDSFLSSDFPIMIPREQCRDPLTFLLPRLQMASLTCLPHGLVILAT